MILRFSACRSCNRYCQQSQRKAQLHSTADSSRPTGIALSQDWPKRNCQSRECLPRSCFENARRGIGGSGRRKARGTLQEITHSTSTCNQYLATNGISNRVREHFCPKMLISRCMFNSHKRNSQVKSTLFRHSSPFGHWLVLKGACVNYNYTIKFRNQELY